MLKVTEDGKENSHLGLMKSGTDLECLRGETNLTALRFLCRVILKLHVDNTAGTPIFTLTDT